MISQKICPKIARDYKSSKTNLDGRKTKKEWYILYTCYNAEKAIGHTLEKLGYKVFIPLIKENRQWQNRQNKKIEVPLFPNYIFVKTHHSKLHSIKKKRGVVTYLTCNNIPSYITEKEKEKICLILSTETKPDITTQKFDTGKKVKISNGPLAGYFGTLVLQKNKTRFGIYIKNINYTILVDINLSDLEIVD